MGYYTDYDLEVEDRLVENRVVDFDVSQVIAELRNWNEEIHDAFNEDGDNQGPCKWYEHEKHLKEFSKIKKYEDVLFILSGAGEESKNLWKLYVMNGKSQLAKAKITYDKFDEKKLK